ncbi:MAG: methyltransferase protein [Sediminibacterium sp.]|nr:methyltransferase protein [Sediminibacterium sp.]
MLYPDKLVTIQDGLMLYVPDPELVKRTYEHLLAKDDTTPFPFWAKIWPTAEEMAAFLKAEPHWITGKRVLELGAGIGLPSFTMAQHAAGMIISDHAAGAVSLIEKNIQYLDLPHVRAMCLDWNHFPDGIQTETLLLSDINYAPDQFGPLLTLIRKFLAQGATIILSTPQRITINPFAEALQPFIKRSILKTAGSGKQAAEIRILVLSL